MKKIITIIFLILLIGLEIYAKNISDINKRKVEMNKNYFVKDTKVSEVINDPAFKGFGRLIFPINTDYWSGETLKDIRLTWYSHINPDKTVEIVNNLKERVSVGETVFFDIYTEAEKKAEPRKKDTGLFFFKGKPNEKFAICNAGGGFSYVGAIHDSFPHALELSKKGYNAFILIYRPDPILACEDLARATAFVFEHAKELEIDTNVYSLWGGSAGARVVAMLGAYGTSKFGEKDYPKPSAVIIQYTGLSEYSPKDPPTFVCVGDNDYISNWKVMKSRVDNISKMGIDTEFHVYHNLGHGFGLGLGTEAEGWIDKAIKFWEKQM